MTQVGQVRDILGRFCEYEPTSPELLWELLKSCSPEVVLDTRFALADGRVYEGRKGVREFFEDWLSSWREWSWSVVDVFDTPNGVVVSVEEKALSRQRIPVQGRHVQQWQLRNGQLRHWTMFAADFKPDFSVTRSKEAA